MEENQYIPAPDRWFHISIQKVNEGYAKIIVDSDDFDTIVARYHQTIASDMSNTDVEESFNAVINIVGSWVFSNYYSRSKENESTHDRRFHINIQKLNNSSYTSSINDSDNAKSIISAYHQTIASNMVSISVSESYNVVIDIVGSLIATDHYDESLYE